MEKLKLNIYKMTYEGFWYGGRAFVIADSEDEAKKILLANEQTLNLDRGKLKDGIKRSGLRYRDDYEENKEVKPTKNEILAEIIKMQKGIIFNDNGDE